MSITKNGNSPDSNGHSNGYTNGAMQYYQAGAAGGAPYGYYYDVAQGEIPQSNPLKEVIESSGFLR